jgi:hypothetical protein
MVHYNKVLIVPSVILSLLIISMLICFFIKIYRAKRIGDVSKIERIEKAPHVKQKWFVSSFVFIIMGLLGSHQFDKHTEDIFLLMFLSFFIYLVIRMLINVSVKMTASSFKND